MSHYWAVFSQLLTENPSPAAFYVILSCFVSYLSLEKEGEAGLSTTLGPRDEAPWPLPFGLGSPQEVVELNPLSRTFRGCGLPVQYS